MGTIDGPSPFGSSSSVGSTPYLNYDAGSPSGDQGSAQISSMEQFRTDYPTLFDAMVKTIGQTTMDQLKASNDRMKELLRNNDGQH